MAFLIQRSAGRGLSLSQVGASVLRIGRGTNQELRSDNPAVALEHAVIEKDAAGYFILDKGSITGTYVNGRPVETARLSKGDAIEVGDLHIDVQMADPAKPLFLRITASRSAAAYFDEADAAPETAARVEGGAVRAKKIDYADAYRLRRSWLTKLSVTALLLIVALGVIGEVIRPEKQKLFMPGGLSSAHARARDASGGAVAEDCAACHTPWRSVSSKSCLDCHPQQPHARHAATSPDCFSCHAEHRGATKLTAIADQSCTTCHASLGAHVKVPVAERASLRFAEGRYAFNDVARIEAFGTEHPDFVWPADVNTLRFNHKLHLAAKGVFNASGKREVLQCSYCHSMATVRGKSDPVAIDFEQHCQSCHRLTFDARFPSSEVPHGGDPGIVYGFVLATYSGDRNIAGRPAAEVRRILTTRKQVAPDARAVLNAEQVLKTKCRLCHEVKRAGERLAVTPPVIRREWLSHARFSHGRHASVVCEKCHRAVEQKVATSDVMLPARADCTECHAAGRPAAQTASACVTCHEYHFQPQKQIVKAGLAQAGVGGLSGGGRMLQGILLAVIVVLLLVVLIPVGIALFRRLLPERAPAAPPAARPAPPPAMPAPKGVPPPQAAPQPAPQPALETRGTVVMPFEAPAAEISAGTEMVQWFGMLHCTSGALEGQRFIIEEDGFYIGRDSSMSKVVIPDTRVSKRHVRIIPRDGRVWAVDEGSTNGTFMKGQRITEVQLKRGDTLVLADDAATFVYQI